MTVTGGTALGKDEIDRMVKDAEAHEEADRKRRESIEMRNQADSVALRTEKLLEESGDQLSDDIKAPVVEALDKLKEALKGTDNDDEVKAAMEELDQQAAAMGKAFYENAQRNAQDSFATGGDAGEGETFTAGPDDVVDAEIVDDENDK